MKFISIHFSSTNISVKFNFLTIFIIQVPFLLAEAEYGIHSADRTQHTIVTFIIQLLWKYFRLRRMRFHSISIQFPFHSVDGWTCAAAAAAWKFFYCIKHWMDVKLFIIIFFIDILYELVQYECECTCNSNCILCCITMSVHGARVFRICAMYDSAWMIF